jgi:hypothetical protein
MSFLIKRGHTVHRDIHLVAVSASIRHGMADADIGTAPQIINFSGFNSLTYLPEGYPRIH